MDNCLISCQVMANIENFYDDFIIINLYPSTYSGSLNILEGCFLEHGPNKKDDWNWM